MKNRISKTTIWIMFGLFFLALFGIYIYNDIEETTTRGIVFWSVLFDGVENSIYSYSYPPVYGTYLSEGCNGGAYDLVLYIIFALYDFPLWLYEKISGNSFVLSWFGRFYAKSIVLFFYVLSAKIVGKIMRLFDADSRQIELSEYLFFFSVIGVNSIAIIGGYDIIAVAFILWGIYIYLNRDDFMFVLPFMIATCCKMFALWVFIPLVLLRYKKIYKLIIYSLSGIVLIVIPKAFSFFISFLSNRSASMSNATGSLAGDYTSEAVNEIVVSESTNSVVAHSNLINSKLFINNNAPISSGTVPYFILFTLILWWICWKKEQTSRYEVVYYCLLGMGGFFLFANTYPYWIILILPFVVIITSINLKRFRDNVLVECLFSVGFVLYNAVRIRHCYNVNLFFQMVRPKSVNLINGFDYVDYGLDYVLKDISLKIGIDVDNIASCFLAVFVAFFAIYLYGNRPSKCDNNSKNEYDYEKLDRIMMYRASLAIIVGLIPLIGYMVYRAVV